MRIRKSSPNERGREEGEREGEREGGRGGLRPPPSVCRPLAPGLPLAASAAAAFFNDGGIGGTGGIGRVANSSPRYSHTRVLCCPRASFFAWRESGTKSGDIGVDIGKEHNRCLV